MKLLVLVGQVPARIDTARLDRKTGRVQFEPERRLNPHDVHALSEAVRLREEHGASFDLLSASAEPHEEGLREALAYGAERALLLTGPHVASADGVGLGLAFAAAVRESGRYDAILLSSTSPRADWGLLAGTLADALAMPLLVEASGLAPGSSWTAEAWLGRERWQVEAQGPLVATVSPHVPRRHPTAWGVAEAVSRPIQVRPLHELDRDGTLLPRLAARAVLRRQALERPAKGEHETFADEPEDGARLVARRLRNEGLWPERSEAAP